MKHKDFDKLLEQRIAKIRETLSSKGQTYSTTTDKLHNFKRAALIRDKHPAEALQGMLDKHIVSYYDMVEGIQNGKTYTKEQIDERFGDIINYMILQEAIFVESLEL